MQNLTGKKGGESEWRKEGEVRERGRGKKKIRCLRSSEFSAGCQKCRVRRVAIAGKKGAWYNFF